MELSDAIMKPPEQPTVHIRPSTERDLWAINEIYNFSVRTSTATFDTEPISPKEERQRWFAQHDARYPVLVAEVVGTAGGLQVWPLAGRGGDGVAQPCRPSGRDIIEDDRKRFAR